jgi:hypothetical protein
VKRFRIIGSIQTLSRVALFIYCDQLQPSTAVASLVARPMEMTELDQDPVGFFFFFAGPDVLPKKNQIKERVDEGKSMALCVCGGFIGSALVPY